MNMHDGGVTMAKYYSLVCFTLVLNLYAHIAMKVAANGVTYLGNASGPNEGIIFFVRSLSRLISNPWVISSFFAGFLASFCWIFALSKLPLSHAYPFLAASFVGILLSGHFLFMEDLSWQKIVGVTFISIGIVISAQG